MVEDLIRETMFGMAMTDAGRIAQVLRQQAILIDRLQAERLLDAGREFDRRAADRVAAAVCVAVANGSIDARSKVADATLDYLRVGYVGGPPDVATWLTQYQNANKPEGPQGCPPNDTPDADRTTPTS